MERVKANLRNTLARLDRLGEGGGAVARSVSLALAEAEGLPKCGDMTGFEAAHDRIFPDPPSVMADVTRIPPWPIMDQ